MKNYSIRGTVPRDGRVIALDTWIRGGETMFNLKLGTYEFLGNIGGLDTDDPVVFFMCVSQWLIDNEKDDGNVQLIKQFVFESPMMEQYI